MNSILIDDDRQYFIAMNIDSSNHLNICYYADFSNIQSYVSHSLKTLFLN